ncbi:MAG: acetyl-CoA carboxylase biotin carboxylase subunit family protein, partial [Haloglomus sp.]
QRDVLVALPTDRDRAALRGAPPADYQLHWVDDEDFAYPEPTPAFGMIDYTERCSRYVDRHDIDGVLYSHDIANLVAGVLCDRHDLPGPSLEAMFRTNHKYYSRQYQPESIWTDYIDLETGEWGDREPEFPCYVKPPLLTMTILQHAVDSPDELDTALNVIRREMPTWTDIFHEFFAEYLDTDQYPLATEDIVVVEKQMTDWTQHCVEGWVDPDGEIHVWAVSDQNYYSERLAVDNYATPSRLPADTQQKLKEVAIGTVRRHGIEQGFWNVEIWRQDDEYTVTEINGRAASVWRTLYEGTFGSSIYDAVLHLSCNDGAQVAAEAPDITPGDPDRVGGQFHVVTFGEGAADELFDFAAARAMDQPDIEVFVDEDETIEQTRTSGVWLARFHLFGPDHDTILGRANEIRETLLKQPETSPEPNLATSPG